jgi:hypothetical protein
MTKDLVCMISWAHAIIAKEYLKIGQHLQQVYHKCPEVTKATSFPTKSDKRMMRE